MFRNGARCFVVELSECLQGASTEMGQAGGGGGGRGSPQRACSLLEVWGVHSEVSRAPLDPQERSQVGFLEEGAFGIVLGERECSEGARGPLGRSRKSQAV